MLLCTLLCILHFCTCINSMHIVANMCMITYSTQRKVENIIEHIWSFVSLFMSIFINGHREKSTRSIDLKMRHHATGATELQG